MRNNFSELKHVVLNRKPDIVFLNETHVTNSCDISDIKIKNYNFLNCPSYSKHTGGVCVFINKKYKYDNVIVINEQLFWLLSFEICTSNVNTIFAGIYLSSKNEHKQLTINFVEKWLNETASSKEFILCGDFNIDMLSQSSYCRRLQNICDENGVNLLVKSPTRITQESATLIDLCATNINKHKISCNVLTDDQISDHCILEICLKGRCEQKVIKNRKIRVWQNYDVPKLWKSLENSLHEWNEMENSDIDNKMNWLLNTISVATKQFQCEKSIRINKEFYDKELELMRIEKNRLYKIAQYSTTNSEEKWHEYRIFKNNYKKVIQTKKYEANQRKLNRAQGDTKATWKVLNSILCKENNEILTINKADGNVIENDEDIANEFNNFFIDSIITLNESIPLHQYEEETIQIEQNVAFNFSRINIWN